MPGIAGSINLLTPYLVWMKESSASTFSMRGKELEYLDQRLLRFEKATSAYGQQWEANEVRIAFDLYAKKNPKWEESDRNKKGAFSKLDFELKLMGLGKPKKANEDTQVAANLRLGVLFFLSNLKTEGAPADWSTFVNDAVDASSDVHNLVVTGRAQGGARSTAGAAAQGLKGVKGEDASSGFLKQLIASMQDYLAELAGPLGNLMREAVTAISNMLPELLKTILGAMLQNLGAAMDIAKNLVQAGRAAKATFSSRHLEAGVMSGHPRTVVVSVREQIKDTGYDGLKNVVKTTLVTGIGVLNPIAGTVVSAIASVYAFITDLWNRMKERVKLQALIVDAKAKIITSFHNQAAEFNTWYLKAIGDLPILSCYCMCMPMTGSYYGFLTLVGANNTQIGRDTLERNYGEFNDVKKWASKFIKENKVKFISDDPLVSNSLKTARGEVESECKSTLIERMKKTAVSMVENAAA